LINVTLFPCPDENKFKERGVLKMADYRNVWMGLSICRDGYWMGFGVKERGTVNVGRRWIFKSAVV
jgi:hypothetical protein